MDNNKQQLIDALKEIIGESTKLLKVLDPDTCVAVSFCDDDCETQDFMSNSFIKPTSIELSHEINDTLINMVVAGKLFTTIEDTRETYMSHIFDFLQDIKAYIRPEYYDRLLDSFKKMIHTEYPNVIDFVSGKTLLISAKSANDLNLFVSDISSELRRLHKRSLLYADSTMANKYLKGIRNLLGSNFINALLY